MQARFDDKVVLVTGASSGIGAAIARGFGEAGATVIVHYNANADEAEKVATDVEAAGGLASTLQADLGGAGPASALVDTVAGHFGRLDVLVNNAGSMIQRESLDELSDDLYDSIMDLNFAAVVGACRAAVPVFREQGRLRREPQQSSPGTIVNVSSISARSGGSSSSLIYSASKGAVLTFTRGLAKDLAADGIRVNAISPGVIHTPFHERFTGLERLQQRAEDVPMGRLGTPEDCVGPALFLASDDMAGYVTGQVLEINGGQLMA